MQNHKKDMDFKMAHTLMKRRHIIMKRKHFNEKGEEPQSSFIDLAKKLRDQKERKKIEEKKKPIWILQIDLMDKILYNKIDNHEDT